jgi:hypothetical protein
MRWLLVALTLNGCYRGYVVSEEAYDELDGTQPYYRRDVAIEATSARGDKVLLRGDGVALHWWHRGRPHPGPQPVRVLNPYYAAAIPLLFVAAAGFIAGSQSLAVGDMRSAIGLLGAGLPTGLVGWILVLVGQKKRAYEVGASSVETVIR